MKSIALLTLSVAALAAPASAAQYPTIVGSWYEPVHGVADCTSHWGTHIKPMSLISSETFCAFDSVKRDGWVVTWTGECRGEGGIADGISVVAIETAGTLDLHWNGNDVTRGLKRCPAGLSFNPK